MGVDVALLAGDHAPLAEAVLDRPHADAEHLRRLGGGPVAGFERGEDRMALDLSQRRPGNPWPVDRARLDRFGEIALVEELALAHHHRALERVLQLAHVARPAMPEDPRARGVGEPLHRLVVVAREAL